MSRREGESFRNFMEGLTKELNRAEDGLYLDDLVAAAPKSEAEGPIPVGERVKQIRLHKGLSVQDVAQRTGLSETLVREIEEKLISPPLGLLIKLAKALEMKMGTLISTAGPKPYTIVRAHERKAVSRYASKKGQKLGYSYQHLAFDKGDRNMEPFLVTLEPSDVKEERSTHDGEEFIFVLEGQMKAHLGETVEILHPGDAIYYDSSVPHLVACHGGQETKILAVIFAPSQ